MKRTFKSVLAVMLVFTLVFGGAPLGALAGFDFKLPEWLKSPFSLGASAAHVWRVGDIGTFGSYPQTRVTDSATLSALNAKTLNWVSYGYYSGTGSVGSMTQSDYMKYADVTHGGSKYRAVKFTSYRPVWTTYSSASYTYQDENGYYTNTTYWFKYEPLRWRVLDPSSGLVMCEDIIDSQAYSNTIYYKSSTDEYYNNAACTVYANDYATSSMRTWLNGLFLQTAFTSAEQSDVKTTALDNSAWPGYPQYNSASTNDKLFLLSYSEATNAAYGFSSDRTDYDPARRAQGSDYAKCQGLYVYNYSGDDCDKNSYWFLRSPGYYSYSASVVYGNGYVDSSLTVYYTFIGVRPAFVISNLSSLIFTSSEAVPVTGVSLGDASLSLTSGSTAPLAASVEPSDATDKSVTWTSSNSSAATVDENGLVTAVAPGTATVTVTTADGGFTDTCAVTVTDGGTANRIKIVKTTPTTGQTGITLFEDELWPRINLTFSVYFDREIEVGTGKVYICKYGALTALKTLSRDTYEEGYIQVDPSNPKCLQISAIHGWFSSANNGNSSIPYGEKLSILMDSNAVVPKDKDYTFAGINDYDTWSFTTAWGLTPDIDLLPFINSSVGSDPKLGGFDCAKYNMSKAMQTEILKNRKNEKKEIQKAIDSKWKGSCYGMTAVTALAKTGSINLKAWDSNADDCFDVAFPKNSKGAFGTQDLLNYYQITQSFSDTPKLGASKTFLSSFMKTNFEGVSELIVTWAKWLYLTEKPFQVDFSWKDKNGSYGHSCLAWGYEHTGKGHEILLYDPSSPSTKTIMLITEDYKNVSLPESAWGDIEINGISCTSPDDLLKYNLDNRASQNKGEKAAVQDDGDAYARLYCYGSGNYTITNAQGETLTCSDGDFSGDMPVYSLNFSGMDNVEFCFNVNKSASFSFSSNDANGYMSVAQDDFFASAETIGADSIVITPGVGLSLTGSNIGYTTYMSFGDAAACDMAKLIGTTGSYLNLTYDAGGEINVDADASGNIEAKYFMDAETQAGVIETENGQAVVPDAYTKKVTGVQMSVSSAVMAKGSNRQLSAVISPNDATNQNITWASSNGSVVSVTQDGIINALAAGTATITATTADGGFTATCEVTVYNNVESIAVASMPTLTQYNYKQAFDITGLTLTATYSDNSTQTITNTSQMTVTGYDAKKTGAQTLTVDYEGCSTSINVTVKMAWWQWLIKILLFGWIWY